MEHLEKIDLQKLSIGEQDVMEMSAKMVSVWNTYQQTMNDEKLKNSIAKKVKSINNLLNQARAGNPIVEFQLLQEYNGLWVVFQGLDQSVDYESELINATTAEKIALFIKYNETFTDEEYWTNLGLNYQMQDYKKIPYSTYYKLFFSKRNRRELLMNENELEFFKALPEKFTIYRGGTESEAKDKMYGVSWTLNKAIAEKFQNVKNMRDGKPMVIHELEIDKSEALAYLNERQEEEIIYIHPKHYNKYRD